jgi:fructose-1,6-bisphosphatase II
VQALGGEMFGKLWPRDDQEAQKAKDLGYDLDEVLTTNRLVSSNATFFACTGLTEGDLVEGVTYYPRGATTESLCMRGKSGTVRYVRARHTFDKLAEYSSIDFG